MKPANLFVALLVSALLVGCTWNRRTEDLTINRSSTCEVHNAAMVPKRVAETYGMKARYSPTDYYSPMDRARLTLFPHADEPHDTGACMRSYDFARIYVCVQCTEARTAWLATQPKKP